MDALIPFVGAYFTPDGTRHAIVARTTGEVHEIFFNTKGKGVDTLACFDSIAALDAFFTPDDGYQHSIVVTTEGNIHEIFFKPNDMHYTQGPLAQFSGIVDIAAFYSADDKTRHVIVATQDGNLTEVYYSSASGVRITQPALARFQGIVSIAAFYAEDDGNRIVLVATKDGAVHEVYFNSTIRPQVTQPALGTFNGIVSIAGFYAADNKYRTVIVATKDGALHEIYYSKTAGVHLSQPALATFNGITAIGAMFTPDDNRRHVIVGTSGGDVQEVFYHPSIGVHITQPPLGNFAPAPPSVIDMSPDPANLDTSSLADLTGGHNSTAGRTVSIAGSASRLYSFCQRAGVWRSDANGPWVQLPNSPFEAQLFPPSSIAVDPNDSSHVVAGNADGLWESTDAGTGWQLAVDPKKQLNAASSVIHSIAFAADSTLFLGVDSGIARRKKNGAFQVSAMPQPITAVAVSQTKVWARSQTSLVFSTNNGDTWSQPIPTPGDISLGTNQAFWLAAFDSFAFMTFTAVTDASCGGTNWLLIFNAANLQWTRQKVVFNAAPTCDGTGGEVNGRKFVKAFIRKDQNLTMTVGQGLQFFYASGQEVYQALGMNADGTMTAWSRIVGTQGRGFTNQDPVHADMWDFLIDVSPGGRTAWVGGDGGVYQNNLAKPYTFPGGGWVERVPGLHTHQVTGLNLLPVNPAFRSRLIYSTSDNNTWFRSSGPIVNPEPKWQIDGTLGDANWTAGDAAAPDFGLSVRHQSSAIFIHFGGSPLLRFCSLTNGGKVNPDVEFRFHFIPSPPGAGPFTTLDAVMMVDLPLTVTDANQQLVPISPNLPLGQSSNGNPVLIRNQNFQAMPDINTSKGSGWTVEIPSFPPNAVGFCVTGSRTAPLYYAFTQAELFRRDGNNWTQVAAQLVNTVRYGPAFVNPFNRNVVIAIGKSAILQSTDAGNTFTPEAALTKLVAGPSQLPTSTVSHIAFHPINPILVVVGCQSGLFFKNASGLWRDLTATLPRPRSTITAVAIDGEGIYVSFDARSMIRVLNYKNG